MFKEKQNTQPTSETELFKADALSQKATCSLRWRERGDCWGWKCGAWLFHYCWAVKAEDCLVEKNNGK